MIAFIIIFSLAYLILALKRLDIALFILIAALPTYLIRFSIIDIPSTLLEVMIIIAFAVWFIKKYQSNFKALFRKKADAKPYPFSWEIIALVVLAFISAGIAGFNVSALGVWKAYFFEPILVFILIMNIFQDKKQREKIYWAFLASSLTISLFAIYQKITGAFIPNDFWAAVGTRRVVSFFEYPNAIGLYLSPLVMILGSWLISIYKNNSHLAWQKMIIILTIIISILAIYFAKSEGALIGLVAGVFVFGLISNSRLRIITIVSALLIATSLAIYTPAREKVIEKITLQDLSGQIRLQQWRETGKVLRGLNIITGTGLDNYQMAVAPYHQEGIFFNRDKIENFHAVTWASSTLQKKYWQPVEIYLYPHNIFLNFWTEIGLLGMLLFIWIIVKTIFMSWQVVSREKENDANKYLSLGIISAITVICIHGLVDVPYFKNDLSVMFFIILALASLTHCDIKYGEEVSSLKK